MQIINVDRTKTPVVACVLTAYMYVCTALMDKCANRKSDRDPQTICSDASYSFHLLPLMLEFIRSCFSGDLMWVRDGGIAGGWVFWSVYSGIRCYRGTYAVKWRLFWRVSRAWAQVEGSGAPISYEPLGTLNSNTFYFGPKWCSDCLCRAALWSKMKQSAWYNTTVNSEYNITDLFPSHIPYMKV